MSHDERHVPGDPASGGATVDGETDRHGLADLTLLFANVAATLSALTSECGELEGAALSRHALAIEAELERTEANVADARQYLRDVARAALMK